MTQYKPDKDCPDLDEFRYLILLYYSLSSSNISKADKATKR